MVSALETTCVAAPAARWSFDGQRRGGDGMGLALEEPFFRSKSFIRVGGF